MNYFMFDASALAKSYSVEKGSSLVDHLLATLNKLRLSSSMLGAAEVVAVLVRKRNAGNWSDASFLSALTQFSQEVLDAANFTKYPSDNALIRTALGLQQSHAINSSDGILLQAALDSADYRRRSADDLVLVASDQRL